MSWTGAPEAAIKLPEQASRDTLAQRKDEASSVVRIWFLGSPYEGVRRGI